MAPAFRSVGETPASAVLRSVSLGGGRGFVMGTFLLLCAWIGFVASAADDLAALSDEFRSPATRTDWQRIHLTEGWGNDPLAVFDIGRQRPGRLLLVPHTSVWFGEWRGELTYKSVTGDFVVTTDIEVSRRGGGGAPNSPYSLAGIMVRAPRTMKSPAQWTPGGQNYVFLSLGSADTPGTYQHEVKTTVDSVSTLHISPGTPRAQIQVARIGRHLILLRRPPGGSWVVHRRYSRPDFPATLQTGLTVYTDWPNCERVGAAAQNITVLTNGARLPGGTTFTGADPDLEAAFDYVRFARPQVPTDLADADLSNPAAVSDGQLLAFLGEAAHGPAAALHLRPAMSGSGPPRLRIVYADGGSIEAHRLDRLRVRATASVEAPTVIWRSLTEPVLTDAAGAFIEDPIAIGPVQFYQATELP
jgi:hypothetical protein